VGDYFSDLFHTGCNIEYLEETALFKHIAIKDGKSYFDGVLFNVNGSGIKYGISRNMKEVLPVIFGKKHFSDEFV
jgi:hypothetical protein